MALTGSGELKFSQMRDEFGGSGQVKFSDLYRGGSLVRAKAGNNTATNLAANVPTSGEIQVADFYSQAKGFRKTYDSGATNQDASAVFGDDYGVDYPKEIVIDSGVELGATSTSQEALQIDSGLSGSLTLTNNGTLTGAGGAAGSAGGDALQVDVACTVVNNGVIRSGGGGGGAGGAGGTGGTGGQGYTTSSGWSSWTSYQSTHTGPSGNHRYVSQYVAQSWVWDGSSVYTKYWPFITGTITSGGNQYNRGGLYNSFFFNTDYSSGTIEYFQSRRRTPVTNYTYYNGGSGGSGGSGGGGGVGQGYNQSAGSGSSGSSGSGGSGGGTNAGSGGTGGTGGTGGAGGAYGAAGSTGATGNTGATGGNGNHTNGSGGSGGSSGSCGGADGLSVRGVSIRTGGITG